MSLVRIPRLWEKRYYYYEGDALEIFDHEERRWNAFEDEIRNQYVQRQTTLVNQINQLDSYIFDVLTVSDLSEIYGGASSGSLS